MDLNIDLSGRALKTTCFIALASVALVACANGLRKDADVAAQTVDETINGPRFIPLAQSASSDGSPLPRTAIKVQ